MRRCSSCRYSPSIIEAVVAGFTASGGGGTCWPGMAVQPAAARAASSAHAAPRRAAPRRGAPEGPRCPGASGGMGLRLGAAAGGALTAGGADRHGDAEVRPGELAVDDLHRAAVGGHELQYY